MMKVDENDEDDKFEKIDKNDKFFSNISKFSCIKFFVFEVV